MPPLSPPSPDPWRYTVPLVIPPGFGSAALHFTGGGGGTPDFITTIGIQTAGDPLGFTAANRVMQAFSAAANGKVCGKLVLTKCVLSLPSPQGGLSVESNRPPFVFPTDGSIGTLSLAIVMQKRTGLGGRRNRGRMFLPGGIQNGEVTPSGELIPALFEKARLFGVAFVNGLLAPNDNLNGGGQGITVSPVLLHSDNSPPTPITSLIPSAHVGYIHGRT